MPSEIDIRVQKLRVLVIDDQSETRITVKNMLSEIGITQIFDAADGKKGFMFMDAAPDMIDMIICDWNMPGMSGLDLLKQLRTVYPDLPFIMITGRADFPSVVEAKNTGVTAYLAKPFSYKELKAKIYNIVKQTMQEEAA